MEVQAASFALSAPVHASHAVNPRLQQHNLEQQHRDEADVDGYVTHRRGRDAAAARAVVHTPAAPRRRNLLQQLGLARLAQKVWLRPCLGPLALRSGRRCVSCVPPEKRGNSVPASAVGPPPVPAALVLTPMLAVPPAMQVTAELEAGDDGVSLEGGHVGAPEGVPDGRCWPRVGRAGVEAVIVAAAAASVRFRDSLGSALGSGYAVFGDFGGGTGDGLGFGEACRCRFGDGLHGGLTAIVSWQWNKQATVTRRSCTQMRSRTTLIKPLTRACECSLRVDKGPAAAGCVWPWCSANVAHDQTTRDRRADGNGL